MFIGGGTVRNVSLERESISTLYTYFIEDE